MVVKGELGEGDQRLSELTHDSEWNIREKGGGERVNVSEEGTCCFQGPEQEIQSR